MSNQKWVYLFEDIFEAEKKMGNWDGVRSLLGGKGAGLADMTRAGVLVPPGFTVTTEVCNEYRKNGKFPEGQWEQMLAAMTIIETKTGKKFGSEENPLLVSCRSGAKFSMPGMMNTILNIGLTDGVANALSTLTGNPRFAWDSYRRLIEMFGTTVFNLDDEVFEYPLANYKQKKGYKLDIEMTVDDWKDLVNTFKGVFRKYVGYDFPQDVYKQLELATEAVFKSWMGKRAVDYRRSTGISDSLGTAVNIVAMVFGNMGDDSCTGVAFTRNPSTGEKKIFGEYLMNAQGEDVVAGIRNTDPIDRMQHWLPEVYKQFLDISEKLEIFYKDMQDVEFTVEKGRLWMLQTRNGKRTAKAALRMAVEMVDEGIIDAKEAVLRIAPETIDAARHGTFGIRPTSIEIVDLPTSLDELEKIARVKGGDTPLAKGVNASPGVASGQVVFDPDLAEEWAKAGKDIILVRPFTKPDDVHGLLAAKGVITSEGGATSHAAVVARQFNKPCVVGVSAFKIDMERRSASCNETIIREGDFLSIDGSTGSVYLGKKEIIFENVNDYYINRLLEWADDICINKTMYSKTRSGKGLSVWANADYPKDIQRARMNGAKGIGLLRTEHMFFEPERLPIVQTMIISEEERERRKAIFELLPSQRADFEGVFIASDGIPVVIRLLDPPLYEFLPDLERLQEELITLHVQQPNQHQEKKERLKNRIVELKETNPMLGLRGIRLGIYLPEIYKMQVRAIMEAACNVAIKGITAKPRIMMPMVSHVAELDHLQKQLVYVAQSVVNEKQTTIDFKFGVMIETPRAALTASEISRLARFFSFGTNDLTQMVFGYSRDDAERSFLVTYIEQGILSKNPFQTIDQEGVGTFMKVAIQEGRKTRSDLEIGVCGEHGGDPQSIEFFALIGLDYVSCSPFRVPVARLSAAHAALKQNKHD